MLQFCRRNIRLLLVAAAVVAFCAVLPMMFASGRVLETGSWGLSFRTNGQPPIGNASQQVLRQYDACYLGDADEKVIYLTFDAGYENGYTTQILDTLKKHNVPACFFLVGSYLENNPELVLRMYEEGHLVGNHTDHHYDMSAITDEQRFLQELQAVEARYAQITGEEMEKYYRPPQGIYSEENLQMAQQFGYRTVFWSLAYVDWYEDRQPTKEEAFSKLIDRIHPGAVVLLHSTSSTNAQILDELLSRWKDLGYTFASLHHLYAEPF